MSNKNTAAINLLRGFNFKKAAPLVLLVIGLPVLLWQVGVAKVFTNFAANEAGTIGNVCKPNRTCTDSAANCIYIASDKQFECIPALTNQPNVGSAGLGEPCKNGGVCQHGSVCGKVQDSYFCIRPSNVVFSAIEAPASPQGTPAVTSTPGNAAVPPGEQPVVTQSQAGNQPNTPNNSGNQAPTGISNNTQAPPGTTNNSNGQSPQVTQGSVQVTATPASTYPPREEFQTCTNLYHCDASQGLVCNNAYGPNNGYCVKQ